MAGLDRRASAAQDWVLEDRPTIPEQWLLFLLGEQEEKRWLWNLDELAVPKGITAHVQRKMSARQDRHVRHYSRLDTSMNAYTHVA